MTMEEGIDNDGDTSSSCCLTSYLGCFILTVFYVGSLYVWKSQYHSTHPSTMKKRMISVLTVTALSPKLAELMIDPKFLQAASLWRLLGLRWDGILPAVILPVALTGILFLGPLSMEAFAGLWKIYTEPHYWLTYMREPLWIRNYIVAPVSEELTFRACMLVLMISCVKPTTAVFICPLFFGGAHLHHMREQIRFGVQWKVALLTSCFQFMYTSIFGAYSAYLFLRTGHLIAPVVVHAFCNHMGFPDVIALKEMPEKQRRISIGCFIAGVILWSQLVEWMTNPKFYSNDLPWSTEI